MYISAHSMVSNSDMIKNYKRCREKAEGIGKVFILKFNEPDAVLFSFKEYEKISKSLNLIEKQEDEEFVKINDVVEKQKRKRLITVKKVKKDTE